jgi:hypothetical protein
MVTGTVFSWPSTVIAKVPYQDVSIRPILRAMG